MGRALLILASEADRAKARTWIAKAPANTRVEFKASKRTLPQNARLWVLLTKVSEQLFWHGQKYQPTEWKDYFMHQIRKARWMPDEDGGFVPIGMQTSDLSKEEHSDLTMVVEEFAARNGVDLGGLGDA